MANTYSQIHLQFIFSPKYRASLIDRRWENDLYKYIGGIIRTDGHKLISVNGMPDHVHLLVGFNTTQSVAQFMQDVKADSSQWVNKSGFCNSRFEWQQGYGVFSYSRSQLPNVIKYIENQKNHHLKRTFLEEYTQFLTKFEIEFNELYIFKEPQ